jgi:hypothetical protein
MFRDNLSVPSSGIKNHHLPLEDEPERLSRNAGKKLPLLAELEPRRAQLSTPGRKVDITNNCDGLHRNISVCNTIYQFSYRYFCVIYMYMLSCGPGSSVGIATGYGLDGPGI